MDRFQLLLVKNRKSRKSEGTAVGPGAVVEERFGAAFGHEAKAQKEYATAIGSGAIGNGYESQAIGRQAETTGIRAVAVGTLAQAKMIMLLQLAINLLRMAQILLQWAK